MLFLRRLHPDRQPRLRCHRRVGENTVLERGHRFHRCLEETLSRNADGVFDAFGIGEGDDAGANWHPSSIGEGKENTRKDHGHLNSVGGLQYDREDRDYCHRLWSADDIDLGGGGGGVVVLEHAPFPLSGDGTTVDSTRDHASVSWPRARRLLHLLEWTYRK